MSRIVLQACLPCLVALAMALAVLVALVRFSGARFRWRGLRELHRSEAGGVQSLAFVLTVPFFIVVVLFIVQVSQLMVGLVVVQYSAFAGARAAAVWIPAQIGGGETQNQFALNPTPSDQGLIVPADGSLSAQWEASRSSLKFRRIRTAAVLGCAPVGPSRNIRFHSAAMTPESGRALAATQRLYRELVPNSAQNPRIDARLTNKIAYVDRNTLVWVEWRDAQKSLSPGDTNMREGPTYNPIFDPKWNEVGWQDPVTVYVVHRFALLPGPGRWIKDLLIRPYGIPEEIRGRVPPEWVFSPTTESKTYAVLIPAAATITNEGLKSIRAYAHAEN